MPRHDQHRKGGLLAAGQQKPQRRGAEVAGGEGQQRKVGRQMAAGRFKVAAEKHINSKNRRFLGVMRGDRGDVPGHAGEIGREG